MSATSPFHVVMSNMRVAIEPSKSEYALPAIKEKINCSLFKYSHDLEGIPVAYDGIDFLPNMEYAKLLGEYPWLHIMVSAQVTIFRPQIGQTIYGRVTKVSRSHVSLLVFGLFNATVAVDKISRRYEYDTSQLRWFSENEFIEEGTILEFSVLSINHSQGVYYLQGDIL